MVFVMQSNPYRAAYAGPAIKNPKTGEVIEALTYREILYNVSWRDISQQAPMYTKIYFKDGKVVQYGADLDWTTLSDFEGERKIKVTTDENIEIKKER